MKVTMAIIKTETKGDCNLKGKSGENGCTQHMPEIWKLHSKEVLGYEAPQSYTNEIYVTAHIVQKWIDKGNSDYQIGLLYNGGSLKELKGTNKFGVKYNTKLYAQTLLKNITLVAEATN